MKIIQEDGFSDSGFSSEMEDLKNGQVFKMPENYFQELEDTLFADIQEITYTAPQPSKTITRSIVGWLSLAASVSLLLYFGMTGSESFSESTLSDADIFEYLQSSDVEFAEIIEDWEGDLPLDEIYTADADMYYDYIAENLPDFEDLIF